MRYSSAIAIVAFLPWALSKPSAIPDGMEELCEKTGKSIDWNETMKRWICKEKDTGICRPDQDQATWHQDPKTGEYGCCDNGQEWCLDKRNTEKGSCCAKGSIYSFDTATGKGACCDPGQVFRWGSCTTPGGSDKPVPIPQPGTCGLHLKDAGLESLLRTLLMQCFPHGQTTLDVFIEYYISILHGGIDLIEVIYRNGCDPKPSPNPTPDPHPGWKCPTDSSPCRWLALKEATTKLGLTAGTTKKELPNPGALIAVYEYPFDTWVTKFPGDDLDIYINDKSIEPQGSGTSYLIPGGTKGKDVKYLSSKGAQIRFYGACSADTPCIGDAVESWVRETVTVGKDSLDIDVTKYDFDIIFTISDTFITTEQYTIFADGEKVDKTHGRLTLGDDKYNTDHINIHQSGTAPQVIANDGFWGSFRILKGTKKITVKMTDYKAPYPWYEFYYRIDKPCQC
ncbi:uncharacterized protein BDW43DRAFT_316269 [Aspergillus alliaceus]|uniref:uncharacterized protein n=1 Tax=Petromyces alliaceus TaxID=209559 RepID=UPI0012A5C75C|nr:uncharacterized protein BDW43DRAFT_316269 [Aspergillus alliaceus]KAB8228067.1 hypothetical protein BDW43DRAFT_316269 [Aspergillus alliaceus]